MSILYPIGATADAALTTPRGRAAREREAERLAGEPVVFVREFTGPVFRSEAAARAAHGGRVDGALPSVAPEDRYCELKPIAQRGLLPFAAVHTAWRLSVAYWRVGAPAASATVAPQARKARRQRGGPAPDAQVLEAMARQALQPIRPQQPLDIGLFETRLPKRRISWSPMTETVDTLDWAAARPPSLETFAALAQAAFAALPEPFRQLAAQVRMQVAEFASEAVLEEVGVDDPFALTGIYQGVSLAERSVLDPQPHLSQVFLYRRAILDEWAERGDVTLGELIANVLVHEIGHHMGLSDADIHAAEAE